MAREPSYPEDAPVGEPADEGEAARKASPTRTRHIVTGAAIGIGSAALVAALLYARSRKSDGDKS